MKITNLKCAVIGRNPVVSIVTDAGISGDGEVAPRTLRSSTKDTAGSP